MSYEFNRNDDYGIARTISTDVKEKGNELFFKYCPYCHGGGKDKETFSINLDNGAFKCFRSSCSKQGHFVELARDFGYKLDFGETIKPKVYRRLPQKEIQTADKAVTYLESRGISRKITELYNITVRKDHDNILAFPFYNEKNELVFVKYRKTDFDKTKDKNKEWCEKDTMPILFGMNHCEDFSRLVITEGQIDSLSLAECEIKNAVSVPTGCTGFTWLDHVWEWITKFESVVVFGDHENGKITLLDTLQTRLPINILSVQPEDYLGEKDANAILTKYGKEAVRKAVYGAKPVPVKHVKELADVESVDISGLPRIFTNIPEIDRIIGGLYFGQVVLITGKRGEGKSTFMSQLVVEAIEQNYPVLVYSGELTDYHFKNWLDFQAAGSKNVIEGYDRFREPVYHISDEVIKKLNSWYRGRAYIYDNNSVDDNEMDSLISTIEKSIQRYGIKMVCVDNLMTALDINGNDDIYLAQSRFVKNLKKLAIKYNVVVLLVAHPKKTNAAITNDDVSGSSDITNRVDVVMSYSRNEDKTSETDCDSKLSVIKNRLLGTLTRKGTEIQLYYSNKTKRISTRYGKEKSYSWEKTINIEDYEEIEV